MAHTQPDNMPKVRKNRPKQKTPFKCYVYRAKGTVNHIANGKWFKMQVGGTVIGEFTCDAILPMSIKYSNPNSRVALKEFPGTCLTDKQIIDYLGNGVTGYGWHISDLKIYDKPKKLNEFIGVKTVRDGFEVRLLERPPQSWCYVEEI